MSNNASNTTEVTITEDQVIDYLRRHPRLLVEQPELLSDIVIPHQTGAATSLVERQVSVLREQLRQSKNQLKDLIGIAQTNTELTQRVHQAAQALIKTDSFSQTISILRSTLANDFKADKTAIQFFLPAPASLNEEDAPLFSQDIAADEALFAQALESQHAICGRLTSDQHQRIFADTLPEYGSAVLLPLLGREWKGVLAIGSQNPERFQKDMGTDILQQLADLITLALDPHLS